MNGLYNRDEKSIYFPYLDIKNEYRWAMINNLPTHKFLWKRTEDFTTDKIDELVKKTRGDIFWRLM